MANDMQRARLLPWLSPEGQCCRLLCDEDGFLSQTADRVEEDLLDTGADVARHAPEVLNADDASPRELHWVGCRLLEALRDALRIAESRGERLPIPEYAQEHPEPAAKAPNGAPDSATGVES